MNISENGINILKQIEGKVIKNGMHVIYDDRTGNPVMPGMPLPSGATIGYGHLIKPGEDFTNGISESKATELLCADVIIAQHAVQNSIKVSLNQNQFDALVIFAFNIGINNFSKSSVVKYINNPNYKNALYPNLKSAWMAWNKTGGCESAGLTKRRRIELNLFTNGGIRRD